MFFNCACWSRTHGYESSAQAYVILGVQLSSVVQEPMFEDMLDADSEWSSVLMSSVLTVMESFLKHLSTETPQQWTWTSTLKRCSDVFYIHFGPLLTSSGRIGIGPWTSQAVILWRILHTKQVWTFIFVNFQSCWKGSLMENLGFHSMIWRLPSCTSSSKRAEEIVKEMPGLPGFRCVRMKFVCLQIVICVFAV